MSVRTHLFYAKTPPPSVRRLSDSLCAGAGKHYEAKVRLNSCALNNLRRRVATGTDFLETPVEVGPVVERVKSLVSDALSDGELSPKEVAGLYAYVASSTQLLVDELNEPDPPNGGYLPFMSRRDVDLKERLAREIAVKRMADDRRKRLLKGIQVLHGMTMAGGLLYALINTADNTEPLLPQQSYSDMMAGFIVLAAAFKAG